MADVTTPQSEGLTPQQMRFVEEYLIDPSDQGKAYIRAGYSIEGASQGASRLMAMPKIKAAIANSQEARAKRIGVSQDRVLQELMLIAFANPQDVITTDSEGASVIDLSRVSREFAAAMGEVTVITDTGKKKGKTTKFSAVKASDKIAALEKLGKHLGMFNDKSEHTVKLTLEQLVESSMAPVQEKVLEADAGSS